MHKIYNLQQNNCVCLKRVFLSKKILFLLKTVDFTFDFLASFELLFHFNHKLDSVNYHLY